jgi:hypothetical protein
MSIHTPIAASPAIPLPPSQPQQVVQVRQPRQLPPMQYEYKTISVPAGYLENLDRKVDKKINEMAQLGWEFVDQKEKQLTGFYHKGRVLQFRRPRPT